MHCWATEQDENGAGSWLGHAGQVPAMIIETVPVPLQKTVSLAPHADV
jgi:hypothetical protein